MFLIFVAFDFCIKAKDVFSVVGAPRRRGVWWWWWCVVVGVVLVLLLCVVVLLCCCVVVLCCCVVVTVVVEAVIVVVVLVVVVCADVRSCRNDTMRSLQFFRRRESWSTTLLLRANSSHDELPWEKSVERALSWHKEHQHRMDARARHVSG